MEQVTENIELIQYWATFLSSGLSIQTMHEIQTPKKIIISDEKITKIDPATWEIIANSGNCFKERKVGMELTDEQIAGLELLGLPAAIKYQPTNEPAPKDLKCMTTHAPFAYSIVLGKNDVEIRRRATKHRGWTLIQAGLSKASDEAFEEFNINSSVERGCIIGAAELVDCVKNEAVYCYFFENPIKFDKNIPIRGRQCPIWGSTSASEQSAFDLAWNQIER